MAAVLVGLLIFCIALVSINYLRRRQNEIRPGQHGSSFKQNSNSTDIATKKDSGRQEVNRGAGVAGSSRGGSRTNVPRNSSSFSSPRTNSSRTNSPRMAAAKNTAATTGTAAKGTAATKSTTATKKYAAVSVRPQLYSCRAVLALENTRFLAAEAPHFPVPGCNAESCRCQYVYYSDRRDDERRSSFGVARNWTPVAGGDRRHKDRRRATV